MGHYSHVIRFCVLLLAVGIGFMGVRSLLVPESFGVHGSYIYGYHRADSDAEQAKLPVLYQGMGKCRECHQEQFEDLNSGDHATLACEACHGPWQAHNNNTKDIVPKDTSRESCLLCHRKLAARPAQFPQIVDYAQHMKDQEMELDPEASCTDCHSPHIPLG